MSEQPTATCGRCRAELADEKSCCCRLCRALPDRSETCWWCGGALCFTCWDVAGHCGHPEAQAIDVACQRMREDA